MHAALRDALDGALARIEARARPQTRKVPYSATCEEE